MTALLMIVGALFFLTGMLSGLISVYRGSKLRVLLFEARGEALDSGTLWKYIKSREGDEIPDILRQKKKVRRSFMLFCIFILIGAASFLAALIGFMVP